MHCTSPGTIKMCSGCDQPKQFYDFSIDEWDKPIDQPSECSDYL